MKINHFIIKLTKEVVMKKHFFKGTALCLLSLFSTKFVLGSQDMPTKRVKLTFPNGDSLDLPYQQATHFGTLKNILEDISTDEITIPVHFGNKDLCKKLIALTDIPVDQIENKESLKTADVLTAARLLQLADYLQLLDSNDKSKTPIKLKEKKLQALSFLFKSKLQDPKITEEAVRVTEETVSSLQELESIAVAQASTQTFLELIPPIRIARHIKGDIQTFSPDSNFILTSTGRAAKLWDTRTNQCLHTLNHDDWINSAHFSPNGNSIVTASFDHVAKLWDTHTGGQYLHTFNHINTVNFAQFSPDGNCIVTTSSDNTAKLWDTCTGKCLHTLNHTNTVDSAHFSPNDNCIVTASDDHTAKLWNTHTGQCLHTFNHDKRVHSAHFSPDGNCIITASSDKTAKLWDAHTGQCLHTLNHSNIVSSTHFNPNGNYIVTASYDHTAKLWNTHTGQCLHTFNHDDWESSAQFSPDGNFIVTNSGKTAELWNTHTGQCLHTFNHDDWASSAQFSPDGNFIAAGSSLYFIFTNCTPLSPLQAWHLMKLLKIEHHETQKIYIKNHAALFKNFDPTTKEKLKMCKLEIDKIIRWRK